MQRRSLWISGAGLLLWHGAAQADELRDFCPDRPGLGTPACTIDPGHAAIEFGLADWTLDRAGGIRQDSVTSGDTLIRYGLTETLEVQLGWQGFGYLRVRDADGSVTHRTGAGDVSVALRKNLHNPDGSGFSAAIMPFVTLPTGDADFGAGDWTAGAILPVSYALSNDVQLAFTGEVDAAADQQGGGHHLAYSSVFGLGAPITQSLNGTVEFAVMRDEERGSRSTQLVTGMSMAWNVKESLQLDAGANVGLNRQTPDLELYFGIAKRF
jgi:hypothetical protein